MFWCCWILLRELIGLYIVKMVMQVHKKIQMDTLNELILLNKFGKKIDSNDLNLTIL